MSKLFACPCGKRWVIYVGDGGNCLKCGQPLSPVDDGKPMPPSQASLADAFKLVEDDDDPTVH